MLYTLNKNSVEHPPKRERLPVQAVGRKGFYVWPDYPLIDLRILLEHPIRPCVGHHQL